MAGSTGLREKLRESSESIQRGFHNPGLPRVNLAFAGSIIGDWAFGYRLIQDGSAHVSSGGETLNQRGPGDAFGEIALLRDVFIGAVTGHGEASLRAENTIARFLAV